MRIVFVGQNPSRSSNQVEAFIGTRSGRTLHGWLPRIGVLQSDEVSFINACEQRTEGNRRPSVKAVDHIELSRRIRSLRPDVVFAVGSFAAQILSKTNLEYRHLWHPSGLNRLPNSQAQLELHLSMHAAFVDNKRSSSEKREEA